MKSKDIILILVAAVLFCFTSADRADAQATIKQFVLDFGVSYNQATVTKAQRGFVGLDIFAGKMLTNNICVGLSTGYDIVSFQRDEDYMERFGVIPVIIKGKYYLTLGQMLQVHGFVSGGIYRIVPHLRVDPVGTIWYSTTQPGGSVGIGVNYWFLLLQGVGVAFEYHFFNTDSDELFSYFSARVDYSIIKF